MSFSLKRDWRSVQWGATLWILILRSFVAGCVWSAIVLLNGGGGPKFQPLAVPFVMVASYIITAPLFLMVCKIMSFIVGGIGDMVFGLFSLLGAIGLMAGDPFVWLLRKFAPKLVPVEHYGF